MTNFASLKDGEFYNKKNKGKYNPPTYPSKNVDKKNNEIMKVFAAMEDKARLEVRDQFNMNPKL